MDGPAASEWMEHTSFSSDDYGVSSISYDNSSDLCWVAHENGRVSSYSILNPSDISAQGYGPEMKRHSSFMASSEYVSQLHPNKNCILSVSQSKIGLHSYGGLPLGSIGCPQFQAGEYSMHSFSAMDMVRDPSTMVRNSENVPLSHIFAGTTSSMGYIFDLNMVSGGESALPYMAYDLKSPVVKVVSNGHVFVAAGYDGSLRLLDGKFRSNAVNKTLEAHSGVINDVTVSSDGRALLTCGLSARKINPYDPNSPSQYANDAVIRVFDLRMQRQLAALPVSMPPTAMHAASVAAAVKFLKFVPVYSPDLSDDKAPLVMSETTSCVLMGTAGGTLQLSHFDRNVLPTAGQSMPATEAVAHTQVLYAPLTTSYNKKDDEKVSAAAVSSSGELISVGSSFGVFSQYMLPRVDRIRSDGTPHLAATRVNQQSPAPVHTPSFPAAAPLLSLPINSLVLGSAYVLASRENEPPLCSSFVSTPKLLEKRLQLTSARQVHPELNLRAHKQDFIGIIANPGFSANSLLFNAHPCGKQPYATCDPRKEGSAGYIGGAGGGVGASGGTGVDDRDVVDGEATALASITVTFNQDGTPVEPGIGGSVSPLPAAAATAGGDASAVAATVSPAQSTVSSAALSIPWTYKRPLSYRGKQRIKQFNYWALNKTPFVGLENSTNNSYANSILQIFYSFPAIRRQALLSQLSALQQSQSASLWIELGFLFHMMTEIERYNQERDQNKEVEIEGESIALVADSTAAAAVSASAGGEEVAGDSVAASSTDRAHNCKTLRRILPVVTPSNFHRAFQVVPEAVALGLMDSEAAPHGRKQDLQQVIQVFMRFILNQLSAECDSQSRSSGGSVAGGSRGLGRDKGGSTASLSMTPVASASNLSSLGGSSATPLNVNVVDQLFGFSQRTTTSFLHSRITEVGAATIRATSVDLIYLAGTKSSGRRPGASAGPKSGSFKSFSAVLWSSLQKESFMKGWCSASEQYEPFQQVRSLASLPFVLTLLCGDTQRDISSQDANINTLSSALELQMQKEKEKEASAAAGIGAVGASFKAGSGSGAAHSLYWASVADPRQAAANATAGVGNVEIRWLPVEIEVAVCTQAPSAPPSPGPSPQGAVPVSASVSTRLVVSSRCVFLSGDTIVDDDTAWVVFDGFKEEWGRRPGSEAMQLGGAPGEVWTIERFNLCSVVSQVQVGSASMTGSDGAAAHAVLHQLRPAAGTTGPKQWYLLNDFVVQPTPLQEVLSFAPWRHPCVVCFSRLADDDSSFLLDKLPLPSSGNSGEGTAGQSASIGDCVSVPESVLYLPSLSSIPTIRLQPSGVAASAGQKPLPGAGDLIAFDGEFVSVSPERIVMNKSGQRVVSEEARQVLARMSLLDGRQLSGGQPMVGPTSPGVVEELLDGDKLGSDSADGILTAAAATQSLTSLPGGSSSGGNSGNSSSGNSSSSSGNSSSSASSSSVRLSLSAAAAAAAATTSTSPRPVPSPFGQPPPTKSNGPVSIAQLQLQLQNQLRELVAPVARALEISPEAAMRATKAAVAGVVTPVHTPQPPSTPAGMGSGGRSLDSSPPPALSCVGSSGTMTLPQSPPASLGSAHNSFNKNMLRVLADDYILPLEPVVDYVTRFSGITMDDLNAATTKHALVTTRTAYLKLRFFIDRKCIFVGHGLQKDFETANIFVPPEQIRDTVELWRLPSQRRISLRFLASYLLREDIQDDVHDSIEDAKTALLLYRLYETTVARGQEHLQAVLQDLYAFGNKCNWTIGLDRLQQQQQQQQSSSQMGHQYYQPQQSQQKHFMQQR